MRTPGARSIQPKFPTGPTEKSGPPQKVDEFFFFFLAKLSRLDRILDRNFRNFWLNGSRVRYQEARTADRAFANFVASHRTLGVLREKMASSSNQEEGKASRKHGFYVDDCFADTLK